MDYLETHILEGLIYLPLLVAALLVFVPSTRPLLVRVIGIGGSFLLLAGSFYVFFLFDYDGDTFQMVRVYTWMEALGIDFRLGVDGIAVPMVLLTGVVSFAGAVIAEHLADAADLAFDAVESSLDLVRGWLLGHGDAPRYWAASGGSYPYPVGVDIPHGGI